MKEYAGIKVWDNNGVNIVMWRNVASDRCEVSIFFQGCSMMMLDAATVICLVEKGEQSLVGHIIRANMMHNSNDSEWHVVDELSGWVADTIEEIGKFLTSEVK
jgi:hypothetical protein